MKRLTSVVILASLVIVVTLFALASAAEASGTLTVGAWTEAAVRPPFGGPTGGSDRAYYPVVIKVGATYHIWYGDGNNTRHAASTFADFHDVTVPAPVITGHDGRRLSSACPLQRLLGGRSAALTTPGPS